MSKRTTKERELTLNNTPQEVLDFVNLLGAKLDEALDGKEEQEWAKGIVDDIRSMCELVVGSIVPPEPEETKKRASFVFPLQGNGMKS